MVVLLWVCVGHGFAQTDLQRARQGGPIIGDTRKLEGFSAYQLLSEMFMAMEEKWFVPAYEQGRSVDFNASISAELPAGAVNKRLQDKGEDSIDFDLQVSGLATPNGHYRMDVDGGLGEVEMIKDHRRRFMSSPSFKSFSDAPIRTRSENANLTNYRGYILRHVNSMKKKIMESGHYKAIYVGTGRHDGSDVHVIRVYKPNLRKRSKQKKPMKLNKLWTFWKDGGYEIWLDRGKRLPRVVFYTNSTDNVFANFELEYDDQDLPKRINFNNNSLKSEGSGDVVLSYTREKTLRGFNIRFDGPAGMSFRMDASLLFGKEPAPDAFRVIPPFGFRKINSDHLKLMVLTQISGGLLKLKKHGVNFKNFKF